MKPIFLLLFSLTLLASCTPTIQVVTLRGSNVQPAEEVLVLDNDTLTLSTDKDFRTEFNIDTKFWASDVKVLPRDQVLTTQRTSQEYQYSLPVPFKKATLPMQ